MRWRRRVAAEFNGYGVWRRGRDRLAQTAATDASQVALDANGDVAVEINGYGVWRYEDSTAGSSSPPPTPPGSAWRATAS